MCQRLYTQKPLNPLNLNSKNIELKEGDIPKDADLEGFWSPSFDWPVIAVHSILLPDETVMTFGSYGIKEKEEGKNISQNKKGGFECDASDIDAMSMVNIYIYIF